MIELSAIILTIGIVIVAISILGLYTWARTIEHVEGEDSDDELP